MEDQKLQKTILWVLSKTQGYQMHLPALTDETSIAIGYPVKKGEMDDALKTLVGERRVEKKFDDWNDETYHITELGLGVLDRTPQQI